MSECPICGDDAVVRPSGHGDRNHVECKTCGPFEITRSASDDWPAMSGKDSDRIWLLSHAIRKRYRENRPPAIDSYLIERIVAESTLPTVTQQAENFILWMGQQFKSPEETTGIYKRGWAAIIGSSSPETVQYIAGHLHEEGYIQFPSHQHLTTLQSAGLTFKGWQRYEELRRASQDSRIGFMAMQFGDPRLDTLFVDFYKPAAELAGYNLRRIDESPPAGSIDDRLRVEIRKARFLVSDLTHDNSGAYWEAGFAEGLEKPVIYSCEKTFFEENGTHFDTNRWHTILWTESDMAKAANALKSTIRETLPDEAQLTDAE